MESCALSGFYSPAQRKRFLQAVSQRVSVRTFGGPPDVARKNVLQYACGRVCLPGVRIEMGMNEPENVFRRTPFVESIMGSGFFAAIIIDEKAPNARFHAGISGEAFTLEAVSLGLGTCWLYNFKAAGVQVPLQAGEKVVALIAVGIPALEGKLRKRKKLSDICQGDPNTWPLWAYQAAECVRVAPSAMNRQPWRLLHVGQTVVLQRARLGDDLELGIALLHLSLGVGEREHVIRWGSGKEVASLVVADAT